MNNFDEYQEKALGTAIYGAGHKIIYPALGLANEAGEVLGKIKKVLRDKEGDFTDKKDLEDIAYEISDVLWYCAALAKDIGYSLETIAMMNIAKLKSRQDRGTIQGSGDHR